MFWPNLHPSENYLCLFLSLALLHPRGPRRVREKRGEREKAARSAGGGGSLVPMVKEELVGAGGCCCWSRGWRMEREKRREQEPVRREKFRLFIPHQKEKLRPEGGGSN